MATKKKESAVEVESKPKEKSVTCGLVMPISAIDGCSADHWSEVKSIVTESIEVISEQKFVVRLVSDADDVGVIQKRIVQNIYSSDVIVCDVSGKNPNVMFELGLRLAFDKPTVIIKDDKTDYAFDTAIIEHLSYPRDLRFAKIVRSRLHWLIRCWPHIRLRQKIPIIQHFSRTLESSELRTCPKTLFRLTR